MYLVLSRLGTVIEQTTNCATVCHRIYAGSKILLERLDYIPMCYVCVRRIFSGSVHLITAVYGIHGWMQQLSDYEIPFLCVLISCLLKDTLGDHTW
jgi:hypothetical protein